jgi:hypothetical protein
MVSSNLRVLLACVSLRLTLWFQRNLGPLGHVLLVYVLMPMVSSKFRPLGCVSLVACRMLVIRCNFRVLGCAVAVLDVYGFSATLGSLAALLVTLDVWLFCAP